MKNEEWRDIPGYEGLYQVSNYGEVKSLFRYKIKLKPTLKKNNYYYVTLHKNLKSKPYQIHSIEFYAFHPERNREEDIDNNIVVNHINQDKKDNRLENLNLLDKGDNLKYGDCQERSILHRINHIKLSKPVLQYDLNGNFIKEWPSVKEIQRQLGFYHVNIELCCKGILKTSKNYIWKYKDE